MCFKPLARSLIVAATVLITSGSSVAQPFEQFEQESRNLPFEKRGPFGGLAEVGALDRRWSVNTFYAAFRSSYPNQTVFWVIRRTTGTAKGFERTVWADSRSCPAVESTLVEMEKIPAVRPDAIGLGEDAQNIGLVMDGTHHIFWNRYARSGENKATVSLEIAGNVNVPIAEWWRASVSKLAQCWNEALPAT